MTPASAVRQIDSMRQQVAALTDERVTRQAELTTILTSEPRFDTTRDIADARAVLARVDRDIALLRERIAAFTAQLPTSEAQAAAEASAMTLRAMADAAVAEFSSRWTAFLAALNAAETAARDLARVRVSAEVAIANLKEMVRDNGLAVAVPSMPLPDATESEVARHIALLLRDVAENVEPDATVEKYLGSLRARVPAAALAPA